MLNWRIEALPLKLKYTWKIARGASNEKHNFMVQVSDGVYHGFGEAAPNIRYGETPEVLLQQYEVLLLAGLPRVQSVEDLLELLTEHKPVNALRFAIESAYLHFFCQHKGMAVYELLGQDPPGQQATCISLPIMEPGEVQGFIEMNRVNRFSSLKVKVNPEQATDLVQEVLKHTNRPIVIDGNEGWDDPDKLMVFLEQVDTRRALFVEQPMPASYAAAYAAIKHKSPLPFIADESIIDGADFELLRTQFHGINIKLMKAGGYLNAIRLLQEARQFGMSTMIGCMIETSLGIWSAMQMSSGFDFADLDGYLILEEEPFGLVKERDGFLYLK